MAIKEPRCKLMSTSKDFKLNSLILETIIKCADELTGMNSEIP